MTQGRRWPSGDQAEAKDVVPLSVRSAVRLISPDPSSLAVRLVAAAGFNPAAANPTRRSRTPKQWNKVNESIEQNRDDVLIVEGVTAYDPELGGMAVFAAIVTTRLLQAAVREAKADTEAAPSDAAPAAPTPPERTMPEIPAHLPLEAQQQLYDLYVAAETYREKLAALEAKPQHKRAGYQMTLRLLENTEAQIAALLSRYA